MLLLLIDKIGQSEASFTFCHVMRVPRGKQKADKKAFQKCVGLRLCDHVSINPPTFPESFKMADAVVNHMIKRIKGFYPG